MTEAVMGRPKRKAPKADASPKTIGIRATPEWAEWLENVARHYRTTVAGVIDRALTEWTSANGYPDAPPERTP